MGKNSGKLFYVAEKYVRTGMFSGRIERFGTSELSGAGKNHGDTFWRHPKDFVIRTQKCLISGKKDNMKNFFFAWSLRFSVTEKTEYRR